MKVEEIFTDLEKLGLSMARKAKQARATARKAYWQGNRTKWDKFNSVARVYEMMHAEVMPLCVELLEHTPADFKANEIDIPF